VYELTDVQIAGLDQAEELMLLMQISDAESLLLSMVAEDPDCIPVLNNLGHLFGRYLSDFDRAIEFYEKVLNLEPDNAWARDERRRYRRYQTYD
jgi:tetratricopeptide (TPR) repeat protein